MFCRALSFYLPLFLFFSSHLFCGESAPKYDVLGIGYPVIDRIYDVSDEFIEKIGEGRGSQGVNDEEFYALIQDLGDPKKVVQGGSCLNTMKGLAMLGQSCAIHGVVGDDHLGKEVFKRCADIGVQPLFNIEESPTCQLVALITSDFDRTMRCLHGASKEFNADSLHKEYFEEVRLVHIEGYLMFNGDVVERAMRLAKEQGALVSFDVGSHEVVAANKHRILHLCERYIDFLFVNEMEAQALVGKEPIDAVLALKKLVKTPILMMGAQGCLVGTKDGYVHSPAYPTRVVDTIGAGDLFASGFIHAYLKGEPLERCGIFGNQTAALVLSVNGAEVPETRWAGLTLNP